MEKASETFLTVLLVWRWPPSRLSAQKQNTAAMDAFWEGGFLLGVRLHGVVNTRP